MSSFSGGTGVAAVSANILSYGGSGNGATDNGPALQAALNALPNGGSIYFPTGTYLCTSDVQYVINSRSLGSIVLFGDGMNSSTIHFNGADFKDNEAAWSNVWNNGFTRLTVRDMTLSFDCSASTGKGTWLANNTLPEFHDVRLRTGGDYTFATGMSPLQFGTSSGPVGETCVWRDVMYEPNANSGTSTEFMKIHYDTFLWIGGGIVASFGASVVTPVLFNLRPVYTAVIDSLSDFVPSSTTNKALYAKVALSDPEGQILLRNCHIAHYTAHFSTDSPTTPLIRIENCSSELWPLVLQRTQVGFSFPIMVYDNNRGWVSSGGGVASVANAGTIAHGLAAAPTQYGATATVNGHAATVTATSSTTLTIGLVTSAGANVSVAEPVAWWAKF